MKNTCMKSSMYATKDPCDCCEEFRALKFRAVKDMNASEVQDTQETLAMCLISNL